MLRTSGPWHQDNNFVIIADGHSLVALVARATLCLYKCYLIYAEPVLVNVDSVARNVKLFRERAALTLFLFWH